MNTIQNSKYFQKMLLDERMWGRKKNVFQFPFRFIFFSTVFVPDFINVMKKITHTVRTTV